MEERRSRKLVLRCRKCVSDGKQSVVQENRQLLACDLPLRELERPETIDRNRGTVAGSARAVSLLIRRAAERGSRRFRDLPRPNRALSVFHRPGILTRCSWPMCFGVWNARQLTCLRHRDRGGCHSQARTSVMGHRGRRGAPHRGVLGVLGGYAATQDPGGNVRPGTYLPYPGRAGQRDNEA